MSDLFSFEPEWIIKNGKVQHCSICGKPQYERNPARGGGYTCINGHINSASLEDLKDNKGFNLKIFGYRIYIKITK